MVLSCRLLHLDRHLGKYYERPTNKFFPTSGNDYSQQELHSYKFRDLYRVKFVGELIGDLIHIHLKV